MALIHEAIVKVMHDCGAVGKDAFNQQQKFKYRGIDAVMNALNPAMKKNGIFAVPHVTDVHREERESRNGGVLIYTVATVRYTFYATDGSSIDAVVCGEGMDSGDKSMNKAMSAAFKYALFQTFCIPTEEMIDSETDSPEPVPKAKKAPKQESKQTDVKTIPIGSARAKILSGKLKKEGIEEAWVLQGYGIKNLEQLTEGAHSWIINNLNEAKGMSDAWKQKQS